MSVPRLLIPALLGWASPALADDVVAVDTHTRAVRRTASVTIDGKLDDPGWAEIAPSGDFVQRFPDAGAAPNQRTEFRVAYDDDAIYIGVRMYDAEPDAIRGLLTRRDQESASDWILVGIDSYHDRRTGFVFGLNPAEVQRDFLLYDDMQSDNSWDAVWTGAAKVDADGWVAEFRIPLSQLRFSGQDSQDWGFQLVRAVGRTGEESAWAPWPRNENRIVSQFGVLQKLDGIEPGRRLEILPYASGGVGTGPVEDGDPFHDEVEPRYNAGVDVKYGLSSAFTLQGTLNPDFGQVEADPSQVNLTSQETFFAEKRPFFLEGTNIFQFGITDGGDNGSAGQGLFYTRRIGAAPHLNGGDYADFHDTPHETTIYGAAKVSGKTSSGWSLGVLEAVTAEEVAHLRGGTKDEQIVEPLTNYALARIHRDLRGGLTTVSGIVTAVNRNLNDPELVARLHDQAYTGGASISHRFGAKTEWDSMFRAFGTYVHGSSNAILEDQLSFPHYYQRPDATHVMVDPDATSMSGLGAAWMLGRQNHPTWNFATGGEFRTPGVEANDMGYQPNADGMVEWVWTGYRDDEPSEQLLNWSLATSAWVAANTESLLGDDARIAGAGGDVNANVLLSNYWGLSTNLNANFNRWDYDSLRGGRRLRDEAGYNWNGNLSTDMRRKVVVNLAGHVNRRPVTDTFAFDMSADVMIQARSNLDIVVGPSFTSATNDHQYVDTVYDADEMPHYMFARIHQVIAAMTVRAAWTFSPRLSLQVYAQPFIATGDYREYKQAADTYSKDYGERFEVYDGAQVSTNADGDVLIDQDRDGMADYGTGRPDFDFREVRSNVVLRWEYRPGSSAYLVWSHGRSSFEDDGRFRLGHDLGQLVDERGQNEVLIKVNYWIGL